MALLFKLALVFLLLSCSGEPLRSGICGKKCLRARMKNHVTRTQPFWDRYFSKPFAQRVFSAPNEVIELITLDNQLNGYSNTPKMAVIPVDFLQEIQQALDELPLTVKSLVTKKMAGVFLVNDLGGTGYTEYIMDQKGKPISGFIVLDAKILSQRTANQWATWKESSPFIADSTVKIEAIIEAKATDNRKNAVQYILLHELGHIVSINSRIHPSWSDLPSNYNSKSGYKFFKNSWNLASDKKSFVTRYDKAIFPNRKLLTYYFGARLSAKDIPATYSQVANSNFVTLYAATNPSDDWAESFVTYVHSKLMKKPFKINIIKNGVKVKTFELCWGTPRCRKKELFLSRLF